MKKVIATISMVLILAYAGAQTKATNADSILAVEANAYIDSLVSHTTLKQFQAFLYENVSQKNAAEGKFIELYNLYLQTYYSAWIKKRKPAK